ncbi:MAG: hypothetical protein AAF388_14350 [Bacteroidota bacterium]
MKHTFLSVVFAILISPFLQAQTLEVDNTRIHVDDLPEYLPASGRMSPPRRTGS